MNLVIDIGNTRTKYAVFDKNQLKLSDSIKILDKKKFESIQSSFNISKIIVSSVHKEEYNTLLSEELNDFSNPIITLNHNTPIPISIGYKTPKTLGKDRIAALIGAIKMYPNKNLLVIDAGTAITYDVITADKHFIGGNISPGLTTRYKSLHQNTSQLPLLSRSDTTPIWGTSTQEAIQSGVQNGIIFEFTGYIEHFHKHYNNGIIIITGGDADFFVKNLKNGIFVHPNLVLIGLNAVLEYNMSLE